MAKLLVSNLSAEGLAALDRGGTSDPYLELKFGTNSVVATKYIPKTLSPVWPEQFTLSVSGKSRVLEISVWDHNTLRRGELGACKVSVGPALAAPGVPYTTSQVVTLDGKPSGKLSLTVTYSGPPVLDPASTPTHAAGGPMGSPLAAPAVVSGVPPVSDAGGSKLPQT
jgi:Ca2+-dependent lipid-binding protein